MQIGAIQFSRVGTSQNFAGSFYLISAAENARQLVGGRVGAASGRGRQKGEGGKEGGGERGSLREGSFAPHERLEIPSSNDAPSPPRCVTGVRMAPLETVSTGAHPLVENTYRRENKLPSYKRCGTSPREQPRPCSLPPTAPNRLSRLFIRRYHFHRDAISFLTQPSSVLFFFSSSRNGLRDSFRGNSVLK